MTWVAVFAAFLVSHAVGDFLLQTEWQATHKIAGLGGGGDPRALLGHIATYTLAFTPALVWVATDVGIGAWAVGVAALIAGPHLVQDDGRLIVRYIRAVKHTDTHPGELLFMAVDQSFHVVALLAVALLASS